MSIQTILKTGVIHLHLGRLLSDAGTIPSEYYTGHFVADAPPPPPSEEEKRSRKFLKLKEKLERLSLKIEEWKD